MKHFLILFLIVAANLSSAAQENLFDAHLRKLSIVVRGIVPTLEEYQKYRSIKLATTDQLALEQASLDFVNTNDFVGKFSNKVSDLFRLRQSPLKSPVYLDYANPPKDLATIQFPSVFNYLVQEIISKNLPWTELLEHTEYYSVDNESNFDFFLSNRRFYATAETLLPFSQYKSTDEFVQQIISGNDFQMVYDKYEYERGDLRVAGVLTTPEFIKRYVSTGVNKNRRRAAAIFRTMLCNDMIAAIPVSKEGADEEKKLALLGVDEYTEDDIVDHVKGLQVHGQNPECMKCHRQLDPLGELFGFIGDTLPTQPSPGALVFKSESGGEINIQNLKGLGDLSAALSQQEDYLACQVRHFWKWVYGGNQMLNPKQEVILVGKFKEVQLKPKDFVKYLVDQPGFYEAKTYSEAQIVTFGAFKTLKKCQSCHNNQDEDEDMKNINWYEVIENKEHPKRNLLINRSLRQLTKNEMPPSEAMSEFSDSELQNLMKWLKDYKTNFDGQ